MKEDMKLIFIAVFILIGLFLSIVALLLIGDTISKLYPSAEKIGTIVAAVGIGVIFQYTLRKLDSARKKNETNK